MTSTTIEGQLHGCRVLIVEDISDLATELTALFEEHGAKDIVLRRSARGKPSGALETLLEEGDSFHIIVVDVMLPRDEAALRACDTWRAKRESFVAPIFEFRERLTSGDLPEKDRADLEFKLKDLRARQNVFPRKIVNCLDREAGVKIVHEWFETMKSKKGVDWEPRAGILFLTARHRTSLPVQFGDFTRRTRWITKPAMEEQIMAAIAELLTTVRNK
jgi:CheY-like chemotaxis protein